MTQADLDAYELDVRSPAEITYRGLKVQSAPPSSSGGLSVLQSLQMLERFPLGDAGFEYQSPGALNVTIEALRLALADSVFWIGDLQPYASPRRAPRRRPRTRRTSSSRTGGATSSASPARSPTDSEPG